MDIHYYKDQQNGQIYLDRIEYTGNGGISPSNYVQFHREERTDELLSYSSHVQAKMVERLKSIEIGINENEVVRAYTLTYKEEYEPSVLASVTQWGDNVEIDEDGTVTSGPESALPPVNLTSQETEDGYDVDVHQNSFALFLHNIHAQGDFNGDGRTDLLYGLVSDDGRIADGFLGEQKICFSMEEGTLDCDILDFPVYDSRILVQGDFNGDGKTDMVIGATDSHGRIGSQTLYTMISNGDGSFTSSGFQSANDSFQKVASVGDFNGDGHTDFITAYTDDEGRIAFGTLGEFSIPYAHSLHKYVSDGQDGFTCETIVTSMSWYEPRFRVNGQPYATGHLYTVQSTGDFNGDGKSDMLLMYSDEYWRYRTVGSPYSSLVLWGGPTGRP